MNERSDLIAYLRGELIGPTRHLGPVANVQIERGEFSIPEDDGVGPFSWIDPQSGEPCEILHLNGESPQTKYGAGVLSPIDVRAHTADEVAALETDVSGGVYLDDSSVDDGSTLQEGGGSDGIEARPARGPDVDAGEDFDIASGEVRHPSTMGISFVAFMPPRSQLRVRFPRSHKFSWQAEQDAPFQVNGLYQKIVATRTVKSSQRNQSAWRRLHAVSANAVVHIAAEEMRGVVLKRPVQTTIEALRLSCELYPRKLAGDEHLWLITAVLRNMSSANDASSSENLSLFQAFFEIEIEGGEFRRYPESQRAVSELDDEEQSMMLLYQESVTWAVGHGCAAAWRTELDETPVSLSADAMPVVELPSMTPEILGSDGRPIELRMRELAELDENGESRGWTMMRDLLDSYGSWIEQRDSEVSKLAPVLQSVGRRHLEQCRVCFSRMERGLQLLREDAQVRTAFRLANLAMLLQQVATKQLKHSAMTWDADRRATLRQTPSTTPWELYADGNIQAGLGNWRAFQAAFLLQQIEGIVDESSASRNLVDVIWFPTGGGKTEAYLGLSAFYLVWMRLRAREGASMPADGTSVLMRYTLRMLTTQQFQRAASLVCALEVLRRKGGSAGLPTLPGSTFSLGLWIGGAGSPNNIEGARAAVGRFKAGKETGNPLILTECPWCRAGIGMVPQTKKSAVLCGVMEASPATGPQLLCPDRACDFGKADSSKWLPIEVVDERIYAVRPSIVIATADKFAMLAYRPEARSLFGLEAHGREVHRTTRPPGLIVQDELHLISGPLGTMYGLYEGIVEELCTFDEGGASIKPKIVASTATIRGAGPQVRALFGRAPSHGRDAVALFPSPGLKMGDSFFGVYARRTDGTLSQGRMYVGIHANEYGSVLTAQVRAFSAILCRAGQVPADRRDPWWTLLSFYNSIRELGGAKTLFDSDIRSRLKFLQRRANLPKDSRRRLRVVEELTSRLASQAEIVQMMDRLSVPCNSVGKEPLDACLASNIIEVGIDIDRLSLMGVVGQPKTTAQYIQVTGRVGRRWMERPGLILMIYNPNKSRDRSHFEQFHSYHRRLYERVEPSSATPFAVPAIRRGFAGALLTFARVCWDAPVQDVEGYRAQLLIAYACLVRRCEVIQEGDDLRRSLAEMQAVRDSLLKKWGSHPQQFSEFPQKPDGEYLMLWPGQFATSLQRERGVEVPSSLRQVDSTAELSISAAYAVEAGVQDG